LGLTICKQLVDLHAGTLAAASDGPGRGSTFTLRLPKHTAVSGDDSELSQVTAHRKSASLATSPRLTQLAGTDVLVVDDQDDSLEMLRQLLENAGATVRTASDAFEALALFEQLRPDLLVVDIGLPQVDGYELLRRIRNGSNENGFRVPAIAVTAYSRSDDRRKAKEAGFVAHIPKPIDPNTFVATVANAIQQQA
jgi:CheY-like chemotaxis protein